MKKQLTLGILALLSFGLVSCANTPSSSVSSTTSQEQTSSVTPVTGELSIKVSGVAKIGSELTLVASWNKSPLADQNAVTYVGKTETDKGKVTINKNKVTCNAAGDVTLIASYTPAGGTAVNTEVVFTISEDGEVTIGSLVFPDGFDTAKNFQTVYSSVKVKGIVGAVNNGFFVIDDGTGAINVKGELPSEYDAGDYISIEGKVVNFYQCLQFDEGATIQAVTGTAPTLETTPLTGAVSSTWKTAGTLINPKDNHRFTFTAKTTIKDGHIQWTIDGDTTPFQTTKLSLDITLLEGITYDFVAYSAGYNSLYSYNSVYVASATGKDYATISGISITGSNAVAIGMKAELNAVVSPEKSNPYVTWASDNAAVVTVDKRGTITGVADGTATITATSVGDSTKTATHEVTVSSTSVLPLTCDFSTSNKSMPAGWDIMVSGKVGTASADYDFYSSGALKVNKIDKGVQSPKFNAVNSVDFALNIEGFNDNSQAVGSAEHVFTVQGYDDAGEKITDAVGYIDTPVVGAENKVTIAGTGITRITVLYTNFFVNNSKCQNVKFKSISLTATAI